ncbi:MAG: hypothetical protein KDE53_19940 [Caldilineaceae bacterium]|nr:hypothetical protein [Caldilineaceae bacterium]
MSDNEEKLPSKLPRELAPDLYELNTHSFVLRIWREDDQPATGIGKWRGHITHVQSGKRRYFQRVCEVVRFISSYLLKVERVAPQPRSWRRRLQQWVCRRLLLYR